MEDMERVDFWKGARVLVTGATGVVGTNLVNRLEGYGSEVVALVRDWVPANRILGRWLEGNNKVSIARGELEDLHFVERVMAEYEIQYIFHLGAQTIVNVGNRSPVTTFRANIVGTWNILESARILQSYSDEIKGVCVASSDKAYGTSPVLPYTEDMPLEGEHPYDVSKSCTDLIARSYAKSYGLPVTVARMGNIYGPGDLNFNRIVPGTIRSVAEGKTPVLRSDGTPVREYFYVEDSVDAYLTMAEQSGKHGVAGEAFNFSSGEKLTVLAVVEKILEAMGSDLTPEILGTSRNEIQDQYLSIDKARSVLGWEPATSFDEGIRKTIEWYRRNIFS